MSLRLQKLQKKIRQSDQIGDLIIYLLADLKYDRYESYYKITDPENSEALDLLKQNYGGSTIFWGKIENEYQPESKYWDMILYELKQYYETE